MIFCNLFCSYDMILEFSSAIFGAEKEFELSHLETCEVCIGTGAKMGSKMRICSTCGGRGQVMRTEQTPFGMFSQVYMNMNAIWSSFYGVLGLLPFPSKVIKMVDLMKELSVNNFNI